MNTLDAIRTKRATRQFTDQPVPRELIDQVLHAGRRSQSSKNDQPWTFIVIQDRATLKQLSECGKFAGHLAGAAFGIALVSTTDWAFDLGQCAAYMQLAAWDLGLGSCIASMWEPDKAKAILGIPTELHFDTCISFGYPVPQPAHPPKKTGRKSLQEIAKWEKW